MISIITWVAAVIAFSFAIQGDKAPKEIYQDGYGTYDIESGLMLDYNLPLDLIPHPSKIESTAVPFVIAVDNQEIKNDRQTWTMTVSSELDVFDMYSTNRRPQIRFYVTGDWVNIKAGEITYQFKATKFSVFPFNPKDFILAQIIKPNPNDH